MNLGGHDLPAHLTDAEEDARDIDAGIVRARIRNAYTPLGKSYIREDIERGQKYNLRPADRDELLRMLDAPAARRRGAA